MPYSRYQINIFKSVELINWVGKINSFYATLHVGFQTYVRWLCKSSSVKKACYYLNLLGVSVLYMLNWVSF